MKELLRSYLKKEKGFTLVELLIVIAIIAILVLIVIIAINPLQRIHDANDRRAESNVRSVASAVEGCLAYTDPTTGVQNTAVQCGTNANLIAPATPGGAWVRTMPANVNVTNAGAVVTICENGGTGHDADYNTTRGTVQHNAAVCP